jgi:predicted transcriptional regulator
MSSCKKNLNNKQRLEILTEILQQEKAGKVNLTEIGRKFNTSRKTVARISESRESLQDIAKTGNLAQKRKRPFKEEDVDSALFLWINSLNFG